LESYNDLSEATAAPYFLNVNEEIHDINIEDLIRFIFSFRLFYFLLTRLVSLRLAKPFNYYYLILTT